MAPIDQIQRRFLREISLFEQEAFVLHNIAPLHDPRQMAALGFLHKRVLDLCPPSTSELLPWAGPRKLSQRTKLMSRLHLKQLLDRAKGLTTELFKQCIFGYVSVYNRLPEHR